MTILFPTSIYYPAKIGGPNYTLLWHTKWLKENNINPVIVTSTRHIKKEDNIKPNRWLDTNYGKIIYLTEPSLNLPVGLIIVSILQFRKANAVHLNGLFCAATVYMIFITWLFRKKVIVSPRGELLASAFERRNWKKRIVLNIFKPFIKRAIFHSTSTDETKEIKNYFGNVDIVEQYNFIDTEYVEKPVLKERNIGYLGRINPIKNIDMILEAAHRSNLFMSSQAKILIAGDARLEYEKTYYDKLKKWIKKNKFENRVEFLGYLQGKAKSSFLSNSYFVFLPSKSENFGNSVVESLSCSTPVVASKGTPWKILEERNAGYWIEATVEALTQIIDTILKMSDNEYETKTTAAQTLVKTEFDVNSANNKWKTIYSKIINGK